MNFNTGNNGEGAPPPPWAVDLAEMRARNMRLMFRIGAVVAALVVIGLVLYVVKDIYTDWLWFDQLGFLDRTPRGRMATRRAYEHLGLDFNKSASATTQASFF